MTLRPDPESAIPGSFKAGHAHRHDPDTSREAAARAEASGLVDSDARLLYRLLLRYPGSTIPELAAGLVDGTGNLEFHRQRLGRRTGDLRKAGLAHAKGKRDGCQCWYPGAEPEAAKQGELFEAPAKWRTD